MNTRNEREAHQQMADSADPYELYAMGVHDARTGDGGNPERMLTGVILALVFAIGACAGWLAAGLSR